MPPAIDGNEPFSNDTGTWCYQDFVRRLRSYRSPVPSGLTVVPHSKRTRIPKSNSFFSPNPCLLPWRPLPLYQTPRHSLRRPLRTGLFPSLEKLHSPGGARSTEERGKVLRNPSGPATRSENWWIWTTSRGLDPRRRRPEQMHKLWRTEKARALQISKFHPATFEMKSAPGRSSLLRSVAQAHIP